MAAIVDVSAGGAGIDGARELFREYARWAGHRDFEHEIAALPQPYAAPDGWLLLVALGNMPAGCLAARRISAVRCEFRRLYVRPVFRAAGLGGLLLKDGIARARAAGYEEVLIEAMPQMRRARFLLQAMGFHPCAPYLDEPTPGADCYLLTL
jgi:GNAT superfamily N-acetyltransferase